MYRQVQHAAVGRSKQGNRDSMQVASGTPGFNHTQDRAAESAQSKTELTTGKMGWQEKVEGAKKISTTGKTGSREKLAEPKAFATG